VKDPAHCRHENPAMDRKYCIENTLTEIKKPPCL